MVSLSDLFLESEKVLNISETRITEAQNDIRRRAQQQKARMEVRPFGWEDLCG
jgi:hypothetical protein